MSSAIDASLRVVAEREPDSRIWSFYLVNDGGEPLESSELAAVGYEWGEQCVGGESPAMHLVAQPTRMPGPPGELP